MRKKDESKTEIFSWVSPIIFKTCELYPQVIWDCFNSKLWEISFPHPSSMVNIFTVVVLTLIIMCFGYEGIYYQKYIVW